MTWLSSIPQTQHRSCLLLPVSYRPLSPGFSCVSASLGQNRHLQETRITNILGPCIYDPTKD